MNSRLYINLAATNLKKNRRTYFPYIITCICVISMYYIMLSLMYNPATGNGNVRAFLELGSQILSVFSCIFLFYTNSFLLKQRKKEFGLYNVLGMDKNHIGRIIFFETIFVFIISVVLGFLAGLLFSKLVFLFLLKLLAFPVNYNYEISFVAIFDTLKLFAVVFIVILIFSLLQIKLSKPMELLQGSTKAEKEPRANWLIAILGFIILGCGYWLSVTTTNLMSVLSVFFPAVILVIIGTYFLFTSGTVAILKILKSNKKFYYKSNHFIAVSGLMYRMKQNAAGLATICILSTGVLVMISSTSSLYTGLESGLVYRYPKEISLKTENVSRERFENTLNEFDKVLEKYNLTKKDMISYSYTYYEGKRHGNSFENVEAELMDTSVVNLIFISKEDFKNIMDIDIPEGKTLLFTNDIPFGEDTLEFEGNVYKIEEKFNEFRGFSMSSAYNDDIFPKYYLIADNPNIENTALYYQAGFDLDGEPEDPEKFYNDLIPFADKAQGMHLEYRTASKAMFYILYGSLFFLGIFFGIISLTATVLIMYYKQISEGYDDKARYNIMRKVGLSKKETGKVIRSQVLTVFFMPPLLAFIHMVFASPSIIRLLNMLNLVNTNGYVAAAFICAFVFLVFYSLVYFLTAGVYYRIVNTIK